MSDKSEFASKLAGLIDETYGTVEFTAALAGIGKAIEDGSEANSQAMADIADALVLLRKKDGEDAAMDRILSAFKDALVKAVAEIKVGVTVPELAPSITVQPAAVNAPTVNVQAPQINIPEPHVVVERQSITSMRLKVNRSQMGLIETIDVSFGEG